MNQSELAIRTGVSAKHISTVINGAEDVSLSFARKLDIALGDKLVERGWKDISHPQQAANGSHTYEDPKTGLRMRYDEPAEGASGFAGKDHYHVLNPNARGNKDRYLDKDGNPVPKGSKASHILPKGD